jgi:hypothetical protein
MQFIWVIPHDMGNNMEMFDGAVRHEQAMFKIELLLIDGGAINDPLDACSFRLDNES